MSEDRPGAEDEVPPAQAAQAALTVLHKDLGTWDTELTITPYPGAAQAVTRGVTTTRLLGGLWLVTDHETESGFVGHGIFGWDPAAGHYVATWVDSMGPGIARGTGTWDADRRVMTYEMQVEVAGKVFRYTERMRTVEDGLHEYSNVVPVPDGEHEVIHATYRRRD
jgi:Protein of unknown function (DUF1579)